jgi:chorismate mutase
MSTAASRLRGLRGAITVEQNDAEEILEATSELMKALVERNALSPEDVVSCIFTLTNDLDAEFPAVAARALGFEHVPLLCAREIPVPGALPKVIRVLIHYYPSDGAEASHVYLRGAVALRTDLQSAQ